MALLSVSHLNKYFGDRKLFADVSFEIGERDKIGLVGVNGSGKTTLFRLLTGELTADGGSLSRARELRVGCMEQYVSQDENLTLWDEVQSVFAPLMKLEQALAVVNDRLLAGETSPALLEQQQSLREEFERGGGLYYHSRVRATLLGLGFGEDAFSQTMDTLSGGQRSKAALGRLLLSDSNLLLLDEPTNHLDIPSVEWLEEFLRGYGGAVMVISHDRYFLDRVTARTWELSGGDFLQSNGSYSVHRERIKKEKETAEKHYATATREIKRIEDNITLLKQWNREKSIRAAESREKRVERLKAELQLPPSQQPQIHFDFTAAVRSGDEVINAEQLSVSFDRTVFADVSFSLRRGERVFLLGPNGCGKTTLLKAVSGRLPPDRGVVSLGAKVSVGYYDQTQVGLDDRKTAVEEVWDSYPDLTQTQIRCAMAAFLFRGDEVFKKVGLLSGGERARLLLLELMLARDNLLLLDEPTNHLDIASREALEEALRDYDGTMLIVSHDRYFINRMANRILYLCEDGIHSIDGNYDDYAALQQEKREQQPTGRPQENGYRQRQKKQAERRRQAAELRRCEDAIEQLEQETAEISRQLADPAIAADYEQVLQLTEAQQDAQARLDELMQQWETLSEE